MVSARKQNKTKRRPSCVLIVRNNWHVSQRRCQNNALPCIGLMFYSVSINRGQLLHVYFKEGGG